MPGRLRLACIGGFLGSGKTTMMINLGRRLVEKHGRRVAIITNDQGDVLVDSKIVRDFGFEYAEVLHGCFCCRFPEFITSVHEIMAKLHPDVVLAEPVGSCTDLLATVYAPLRRYYSGEITLAPYTVLVDASTILRYHGKYDLLSPKDPLGSLLSWQIKEAEIIAINKVDLVSAENLAEVENLVRRLNSEAEVLRTSAKTGYNLDVLTDMLLSREHKPRPTIEVDYDTYGTAEAKLGWFNGSWKLSSKHRLKLENLIGDLVLETAKRIEDLGGLVVHLKVSFWTGEGSAKASYVLTEESVDFTGTVPPPSDEVDVIMNIRALLEPEAITDCVKKALEAVALKYDAEYSNWVASSFKPSYPKPYYRLPQT
ncbi:hypothetical protein DRO58_01535 [Candidatus Bathyarchaeota archaeon]|nr:MAG: hypothetical protein DRO58_01535 [Candidatus Bathyarchaeota archaeon]